jgi:hypothetical protein
MKIKFILGVFALTIIMASCSSTQQIGKVNMISTRNVDSKNYVLIKTYAGSTTKELKKSRASSIEEAINNTVKAVPGGEYLMNVAIFLIKGKYYAVQGDVYGLSGTISYRGFVAGDKVTWEDRASLFDKKQYVSGTIISLKDDNTVIIKLDNSEKTVEISYDKISKIQK